MKQVWVESGCIVCRACENICPEVFFITEETAVVRRDADLRSEGSIREAAEACPVEVIKFEASR